MAKISELISGRIKSGQSRTGSLVGSLKDKLKESIDPRQFINQTGIMASLFPSLKAYSAKPVYGDSLNKTENSISGQNSKLIKIEQNTSIFAKNMMYLPEISREIKLSSENIKSLIREPLYKTTPKDYFQKASDREKLYEAQIKESSSKFVRMVKPTKKSKFSWLKMLGLIGTAGVSYLIVDFLKNKQDSIVEEIYDKLTLKIDEFRETFSEITEQLFDSLKDRKDTLFKNLDVSTDKLISDIGDIFTFETIQDYILNDTGPLKKYSTAVAQFKDDLAKSISDFSIIPAAQAATLPSIMPSTTLPTTMPSRGLPGAPSYGVSEKENQAVGFFEGRGWTREQSIGIVANLIQESNLDPAAFNKKENALGIAQWRASRLDDFEKRYGKSVRESSLEEQLDFIDYELKQGAPIERRAGKALRETKTVQEATAVIDRLYERSAGTELNVRLRNAERLAATNSAATGMTPFRITSRPGQRFSPFTRRGEIHGGFDIPAPIGTPIYSVSDGTISFVGEMRGYGKTIKIDHGNGTVSLYAHQSAFAEGMIVGTKVTKGQLIGYVGSTGLSTGPHLHFELLKDGKIVTPSDDVVLSTLVKVSSSLIPGNGNSSYLNQMSAMTSAEDDVGGNSVIVVTNNVPVSEPTTPSPRPNLVAKDKTLDYWLNLQTNFT